MPNRLLKEGICTSDTLNKLSPQAEVFFYRLLVVADDFGRMDARPAILKSACFPLKDSILLSDVSNLLSDLADAKLVTLYDNCTRPLLQINKWEQRIRSRGKYPAPDSNLLSNDRSGLGLGLGLGYGKGKGLGEAKSKPVDKSIGQHLRRMRDPSLYKKPSDI